MQERFKTIDFQLYIDFIISSSGRESKTGRKRIQQEKVGLECENREELPLRSLELPRRSHEKTGSCSLPVCSSR